VKQKIKSTEIKCKIKSDQIGKKESLQSDRKIDQKNNPSRGISSAIFKENPGHLNKLKAI
jgi:hypothetical protein